MYAAADLLAVPHSKLIDWKRAFACREFEVKWVRLVRICLHGSLDAMSSAREAPDRLN